MTGGPLNGTVASLTGRSLLGRRRTFVLLLLPVALLFICTLARILGSLDGDIASDLDGPLSADLLGAFGLAILMPLLSLIAGTGAIGPEIDEGSIVYLLAKPLNRHSIVLTKLLVALAVVVAFGVLPIAVAGVVLTGEIGVVTLAFTLGSLAAGVAYSSLFLLLAVITRNAVVVGLVYALVWESLVGGLVPGAQALSVQQWSMAIVQQVLGDSAGPMGVDAAVGLGAALVMLLLVTVAATFYAGRRLQTLRITEA
jgi:ABC-2 type transport system permease protein